jgi:hypothetical protein
MKLEIPEFSDYDVSTVELQNVTGDEYERIVYLFREYMGVTKDGDMKRRMAVAKTFLDAIEICPDANPSDLWHHIIYREYLRVVGGMRPDNSWVRTSGEGFEIMLVKYYNDKLKDEEIRLDLQFSDKKETLNRLGEDISEKIGNNKIDIIVEKKGRGKGIDSEDYGIVGIVNAKASLAERVSDDVPAGRILMDNGLFSVLATLDVKSVPPSSGGDLVNRGEFGTPSDPTDKREYVEEHGDFSICFSWNQRTTPSREQTPSGSRIETVDLSNEPDAFTKYLRQI